MENRFEHFTLDIFNISRYWNRIATEEMKKYGLRGTHALYLLLLDGYEEEITAARLADLCQRDKADVSRAIADFQKKGIVEPYTGSRYRVSPRLTPLGRTIAGQIRSRAEVALEASVLCGIYELHRLSNRYSRIESFIICRSCAFTSSGA